MVHLGNLVSVGLLSTTQPGTSWSPC